MSDETDEYGMPIKKRVKSEIHLSEDELLDALSKRLEKKKSGGNDNPDLETRKEMLLDRFPKFKEYIDVCEDQEELDMLAGKLELGEMASGDTEIKDLIYDANNPKKKTVTGRAPMGQEGTGGYENTKAMLDALYKTAFWDLNASDDDKLEARRKINKLLDVIEKRKLMNKTLAGHVAEALKGARMLCPSCSHTIELDHPNQSWKQCPNCHWKPSPLPDKAEVW